MHFVLAQQQQGGKPRLEEDSVIVKLLRYIMAKLQECELAKDLEMKLIVVDDYCEFLHDMDLRTLLN